MWVKSERKNGTVIFASTAAKSICVDASIKRKQQYYNPLTEKPVLNLQRVQYKNFIYINFSAAV